MTGYQLSDIGAGLDWGALRAFLMNLGAGSALMHELHPEESAWGTRTKTNGILADIYDILAQINANLIAIGSGRPAKKPKPYPRPRRKEPKDERHFGRDGLPPDELRKWIAQKRKQHAGSSKRNLDSDPGPVGSTAEPDGAADR